MIQRRASAERGHANHGWLDSFHTFSFADYYDSKHMNFSVLRVINEDRIQGGMGFRTHPHQHMEIITYVISGALEHKDSLGTQSVIRPFEVQRMSAGTGITHSEFNHMRDEETHLLQIWILPDSTKYTPSYGQKSFAKEIESQPLTMVASETGESGTVSLHQNIKLYVGKTRGAEEITLPVIKWRTAWLQLIEGEVEVGGISCKAGDGLSFQNENDVVLRALGPAHFLFFDLPQ